MPQTKYKLDIFKVLARLSNKDHKFYRDLSEEEQKSLFPLILMRWLSGTKNAQQIYFLNELVNPFVFAMYRHKELLFDLLTVCAPGRTQRYYWNKAQSKRTTSTPKTISVIRDYFGYNTTDASSALPLLNVTTILGYAEELGLQPDEINLIKKELVGHKPVNQEFDNELLQ